MNYNPIPEREDWFIEDLIFICIIERENKKEAFTYKKSIDISGVKIYKFLIMQLLLHQCP